MSAGHFTNGVFAAPVKIIFPTNLACFQRQVEKSATSNDALIIAVNSNESVEVANQKIQAQGREIPAFIDQMTRANNIAKPLSLQHPDREVIVLFYDEEAPAWEKDFHETKGLYDRLKEAGFGLKSLFKGNFGTNPKAGPIIGEALFDEVIAFPLPHDTAALSNYCAGISGEARPLLPHTKVIRLTEEMGVHGYPYMNEQNKVLFPVKHPDLEMFRAPIPSTGMKLDHKPVI